MLPVAGYGLRIPGKVVFLALVILFHWLPYATQAQQPDYPNNKFGIHLNQPEDRDIESAAGLVNSNGGDWGYVTLVVREEDRDVTRMNDIFNKLRKNHLIPLIRLATRPCGSAWCRPEPSQAVEWADFLSGLNWPTQTKAVILFNEPNHGQEWGGEADAIHYAEVADKFCTTLKTSDNNFFVMMAGLDAAAPQRPPQFMNEAAFLDEALGHKPELSNCFDGWASHSYPNHGYVSSPFKTGRNSVRTYEWELAYLKKLGVSKDLCVYITESGWPHREGTTQEPRFHPAERAAQYFADYFNLMQNDDRVCAVTPFIINDQSELFEHFSWRLPGGEGFYPQYDTMRGLEKQAGSPPQKQLINIKADLPKQLTVDSNYRFDVAVTNGGQAWWDQQDGYRLGLIQGEVAYSFSAIADMQPGVRKTITLGLKTDIEPGQRCIKVGFYKGDNLLMELFDWCYEILPAPRLEFKIGRFIKTEGDNFEIQLFDNKQNMVFSQTDISAPDGIGVVPAIENVIIGECYRVVLLKDYHLPRQVDCVTIESGTNEVRFEAMIPIDFDNDGQFTLLDILNIRRSRVQ